MILQVFLHGFRKTLHRQHKAVYGRHHLAAFAFPFQWKQLPAAFIQLMLHFGIIFLNNFLQRKEILLHKHCAVHFTSPFHQIMRLINQEKVLSLHSVTEKPF